MQNNANNASLGRRSAASRSPSARADLGKHEPSSNRGIIMAKTQEDAAKPICVDRSWASLQQSVADRCVICMRIASKYEKPLDAIRVLFHLTKNEPGFDLVVYIGPETEDRSLFRIRPATDWTPITTLGLQSTKEDSTGNEAVAHLLRGWMNNCVESHAECQREVSSPYQPSRLLEVSEDMVRLVERDADDAADDDDDDDELKTITRRYATMSHCWGGKENFLVLRPENYAQFRDGLPISEFEPSFRDVFLTVRRLGLVYIWIDCFCILQGNSVEATEDWRQEADKMKLVYLNSFVNLSATHAKNPSEGCFTTRSPSAVSTPGVFVWPGSPEQAYQIYSSDRFYQDVGVDGLKANAIFSRAWIYQERLLSRRMIHFSQGQVYWECSETPLALESFPDGIDVDQKQYVHMAPFSITQSMGTTSSEMLVGWHEMLDQYARCALTFPSKDKLLALGGVAKHFAESVGKTYTGGYWRDFVVPQLCWRQAPARSATRSLEWRAPSWSWASMDGPLNFCNVDMHFETHPEPDYKELVSSIMVDMQPKTAGDGFGPLSAGSLILRGRLINATVGFQEEKDGARKLQVTSVDGISSNDFEFKDSVLANFDDPGNDFAGQQDTWDVEILLLRVLPMSHRLLVDAKYRISEATTDDILRGAELQTLLDGTQARLTYAELTNPPTSRSTFDYPLPKPQGLFLKKTSDGDVFERVGFVKAFRSLFLLQAWTEAEEREITVV